MEITKEFLKEKNACREGVDWFLGQSERQSIPLLERLITVDKLDWALWLIVRVMDRPGYLRYAVFAAEQVVDIFERKYPRDKRPRRAIAAAKRCAKNPSSENKKAAAVATYAAYASYVAHAEAYATYAAHVAHVAHAAAVNAAYAAYVAARAAAYSADATAYAATTAAEYAADTAEATASAKKEMKIKILKYGIKLLTVIRRH